VCLAEHKEKIPNQIGLKVETLLLRCLFQLLYGINSLDISLAEQHHQVIQNTSETKKSTACWEICL
jgi:hypothetical protein